MAMKTAMKTAMRSALVCVVLAPGCSSNGTGTVVYSEQNSGHIWVVDVATGDQTNLDLGFFGAVSIAPDQQHIAYMGSDFIPKVADLNAQVTQLPSTNSCGGVFTWGPNSSLAYCIANFSGSAALGFMPTIGAPVRTLKTNEIAQSSDGKRVAYLELTDPQGGSMGDLVVENADGSDRDVLLSGIPAFVPVFLPDDSGLVFETVMEGVGAIELKRIAFATHATSSLGLGVFAGSIPRSSRFSPDGREVLAIAHDALVGIDVTTGEARTFSNVSSNSGSVAAAFLDRDRVIYQRFDSVFMGGDAGTSQSSVRISDGEDRVILTSSDGSSQCTIADLSVESGLAALTCAVPAIVNFDGELVASRDASLVLGLSADGNGMVTVGRTGAIEYDARGGSIRHLADANLPELTPNLNGPFAAYAP